MGVIAYMFRLTSSLIMPVALALAALALGITHQTHADAFDDLMDLGDERHEKFDNRAASDYYKQAHSLKPENYEALMKLTRAYNDWGEDLKDEGSKETKAVFIEATKWAELLREKHPDRAETYGYLVATYGNLSLYEEGKRKVELAGNIEVYANKAIELDPTYPPPYIALGVYYREIANLSWFLKKFAKLLYGKVLKGSNEDSERMLLKGLELNPNVIFANYQMALTYENMNQDDKAVEFLEKALQLPVSDHQDAALKLKSKKMLTAIHKRKGYGKNKAGFSTFGR